MPRSLSARVRIVAVVRLPIDAWTGDRGDPAAEHPEVLLVAGAPDVEDRYLVRGLRRCELGVVVQELMEAVDDVHSSSHGLEHDATFDR
jgi:hypothetical protein